MRNDWGVEADVWSVTSFNELRREGLARRALEPAAPRRGAEELGRARASSSGRRGPVVAATDYMKTHADQIRAFVPGRYVVLGTDGFGRSDTRERLRHFFEVNRYYVALAALKALADDGELAPATVAQAIEKYGIDPGKPPPARS